MDIITTYIILALVGYVVAVIFTKLFAYYAKIYLDRAQKKREEKRKEKLKWKYAEVNPDNPLLNRMMNDRTIIFMGHKGKGKSLMMNLVAHFLWQKRIEANRKNKRYNRFVKPEYLKREQMLEDNNLLPIYSNLDFLELETGAKKQDLGPFFEMRKKAVEGAIFCIDEVSSTYGKDFFYSQEVPDEVKRDIKENSKKNRHFTAGWILGTEQDGDDIFKGIRENGYALVNCLETRVHLSPNGKIIRKLKNAWNLCLPAIFTTNVCALFREQLFWTGKLKLCFKLLLPSFFSLPKQYYLRRQAIFKKINQKYQRFETRFIYDNGEWWIRYTHDDLFEYDTRAYKKEYDEMFDENGDRIYEQKQRRKSAKEIHCAQTKELYAKSLR